MNNINITFTESWVLWLILPALALTIIPLFFIHKKRRCKAKYISSVIMRSIAVTLILTMLAGFTVTNQSDLTSVVILVDLSDSAQTIRPDIKNFVNGFTDSLDGETQIAMVGFAHNTVTEVGMDYLENATTDQGYYRIMKHPFPSATATNIQEALEYAAGILPDGTNKRIVLLSDGLETDGHAETTAKDLAADGIRVDVVEFNSYDPALSEVQVTAVEVKDHAYVGDPVTVAVTLTTNTEADVTVSLSDDGVDVEGASKEATLSPGANTVEIDLVAGNAGVHSLKATVTTEMDTVTVNNSMYNFIKVSGDPQILIVDGEGRANEDLGEETMIYDENTSDEERNNWQQAHELVKLLDAVDYQCTVIEADDFPRNLSDLRVYDEIIFMNVDTAELPSKTEEKLKEYVSRLGRGLFTTGGERTYIYGSMEGTLYEEMLPINMKVDEDELPSTALALVIDNSSSMDGSRRNYAKKGAIASVNALNKKDFTTVITFAMDADVVVPLTSTYDTTEIVETIADIRGDHQTHLYPALQAAYDELKKADTEVRRVMILSDGEPSPDDNRGYSTIVRRMKNEGITVSTIYLGNRGGGGQSLMENLANIGGGNFYLVESAEDLANVMLQETLSVDYINNITFTPTASGYSQVLTGVTAYPELDGYISSSSKEHATVVLSHKDDEADIDRPIYAEWQYGLGRTASFTSDLSGAWSSKWLADENGVTFIRNVVSSLLPADGENTSMKVEVETFSRSTDIAVSLTNLEETDENGKTVLERVQSGEITLEAFVSFPGAGKNETLELTSTGIGEFTGNVKTSSEGVYILDIYQYDQSTGSNDPVAHTEQAFCLSYSKEYDVFAEPTELLSNIAMLTGGTAAATVDDLLNTPTIPMEDVLNTFTPMAIIATLLLLADIIVRKLKWKDLQYLFRSVASKFQKKKVV